MAVPVFKAFPQHFILFIYLAQVLHAQHVYHNPSPRQRPGTAVIMSQLRFHFLKNYEEMNVYFGVFSGVAFDLLCIETETWRNPLPPQHRVILNEDHTCSYENRGMVY